MENKVMELVNRICNTDTNCRGLINNTEAINSLLELKGINLSDIRVYEVPINWNNQVLICYENLFTNEYRQLFCGIGTDGNFYFEDKRDEEYYSHLSDNEETNEEEYTKEYKVIAYSLCTEIEEDKTLGTFDEEENAKLFLSAILTLNKYYKVGLELWLDDELVKEIIL